MTVLNFRNFPSTLKNAIKSVAGAKGQSMVEFAISLFRSNKEIVDMEKNIINNQKKKEVRKA